jgi:2-amino-4-hydroxy-6-hydroxymethyldihydropteridine diphosphokinase
LNIPPNSYAIALGSNRPHGRHGSPEGVLGAAVAELRGIGRVELCSPIHRTAALGPAGRSFANAAALVTSDLDPPEMLEALKATERDFGRRPGRRWGPRVLDLDILLWSGGAWGADSLVIPHPEMRRRLFVLEPLADIAPTWRDPVTGLTVRQLLFRARARRG